MKYNSDLATIVDRKISIALPENFSIIVDGWSSRPLLFDSKS